MYFIIYKPVLSQAVTIEYDCMKLLPSVLAGAIVDIYIGVNLIRIELIFNWSYILAYD